MKWTTPNPNAAVRAQADRRAMRAAASTGAAVTGTRPRVFLAWLPAGARPSLFGSD